MNIDENYIEKLCNTIAKTILETFEGLSIEDVNMYQFGYNKAIDDFVEKINNHTFDEKLETNYSNSVSFMREIRKIAEQLKNHTLERN